MITARTHLSSTILPGRTYEDVLKLGTSQMMENRFPDARELSYQHLMEGSVKQTFKASRSRSSEVPAPRVQPEASGFRRKRTLFLRSQSLSLKNSQSSLSKVSPAFNS